MKIFVLVIFGNQSNPLLFYVQLLESFEESFPGLDFPPLPERGDFDLKDVLESPYFFNWSRRDLSFFQMLHASADISSLKTQSTSMDKHVKIGGKEETYVSYQWYLEGCKKIGPRYNFYSLLAALNSEVETHNWTNKMNVKSF